MTGHTSRRHSSRLSRRLDGRMTGRIAVSALAGCLVAASALPTAYGAAGPDAVSGSRAGALAATMSGAVTGADRESAVGTDRGTAPAKAELDLRGTVSTYTCSGSVVRWPSSRPADPALVLTNGHCAGLQSDKRSPAGAVEDFLGPRDVWVNRSDRRTFSFHGRAGRVIAEIRTDKLVYATRFRTDVALYQLPLTYRQLAERENIRPLTVVASRPTSRQPITIPSGYWRKQYECGLQAQPFHLDGGPFDMFQALRYSRACDIENGSSGSPVLNADRRVIGINAWRNSPAPETCSKYQGCEKNRAGEITAVFPNRGYGGQTWWLTTCLRPDRTFSLRVEGCRLPKPRT